MAKKVAELDLLSDLQPTLEILDKIVAFEEKIEYNRLLIFTSVVGFIAIIGGWIEYVCYRFLSLDSTFLIFEFPPREPILVLGLWLIYLLPLIGVLIFTTGISPGFISWNKAYRSIGAIAIGLFIVTHITILLVGIPNQQFIPLIWGTTIGIGFLFAGRILFLETKSKEIRLGLYFFGLISLILGSVSSLIIYPIFHELAMFLFCNIFGLLLIMISMITYWNAGRRTSVNRNELK
ncbi:MAG: hypothetical protein ACXAC8_11995 [Candidatus Hodarchaeales archaeon]|jgi:hypothetical protein